MDHDIKHLAIIMDGNNRWATANGLTKAEGYKQGANTAKKLTPEIMELGISYLTLYAFSSENWKRPEDEILLLMGLLSYFIENEVDMLHKHKIRLKVIGNLNKISNDFKKKIDKIIKSTEDYDKMTVCIALSYGSKAEIVNACQQVIHSGEKEISEEIFSRFLYDKDMPDVDLMIRPGGVYRISNFLLWQSAYAELWFTDKFWPALTIEDIKEAIEDYRQRKRYFGGR